MRSMRCFLPLLLLPCLILPACGPADVAGEYSLAITNRENGCGFSSWTEGDQTTGVSLSVTQEKNAITASVGGLTAILLDLLLGDHVFTGEVRGDTLDLTLFGTRSQSTGNCSYTTNAHLVAVSTDDVLVGEIRYTEATNGNPDCEPLQGCVTRQAFNGTRPPPQ